MKTLRLETEIGEDGRLMITAATGLPPGSVDVVLVLQPKPTQPAARRSWRELHGLGKEIWQGIDAQEYVNELREEWDR